MNEIELDLNRIKNCRPFQEIEYQRPDVVSLAEEANQLDRNLGVIGSHKKRTQLLIDFEMKVKDYFEEYYLLKILNHQDEHNPNYINEKDFFNEIEILIKRLLSSLYASLQEKTDILYTKGRLSQRFIRRVTREYTMYATFSQNHLLEEKKALKTYTNILSSVDEMIKEKHLTNSNWRTSTHQKLRLKAESIYFNNLATQVRKIDSVLDEVILNRIEIAQKSGYKNYQEAMYTVYQYSNQQSAYQEQDRLNMRKWIKKYIQPIGNEILKRKKNMMNLDRLYRCDLEARIPGWKNETDCSIVEYPEVLNTCFNQFLFEPQQDFIKNLFEKGYIDILYAPKKKNSTRFFYLPEENMPFVFANAKNKEKYLSPLIQHLGQALSFLLRNQEDSYLIGPPPTVEKKYFSRYATELLSFPQMEVFWKDRAQLYTQLRMEDIILELIFDCLLDEFQESMYTEMLSSEHRVEFWSRLLHEYFPRITWGKDEAEDLYLYTQKDMYLFPFLQMPKMYACLSAFSVWVEDQKNHKQAVEKYLSCMANQKIDFTEHLESIKLESPLVEGTMKKIAYHLAYFIGL